MRYGVALPTWNRFAEPGALGSLASAAEELGYDSIWISDHIVLPAGTDYPPEHQNEPLATLAWLAATTSTITLGTSVLILPYRNPVFTAKFLGTVDLLSGGRLDIGVGVGWVEEEFGALGVPFEERGARTDEAMRVMRNLWETHPSSFEGRWSSYQHMSLLPKGHPARKETPEGTLPLLVGGNSRRAIRRAAELGDGWHPINRSPAELGDEVEAYREACAAAGREPGRVVVRQFPGYGSAGSDGRTPLTGSPEEQASDVRAYEEAGCDELVLSWETANVDGLSEYFRNFATQIMPLL